jgi:hypothetical protein
MVRRAGAARTPLLRARRAALLMEAAIVAALGCCAAAGPAQKVGTASQATVLSVRAGAGRARPRPGSDRGAQGSRAPQKGTQPGPQSAACALPLPQTAPSGSRPSAAARAPLCLVRPPQVPGRRHGASPTAEVVYKRRRTRGVLSFGEVPAAGRREPGSPPRGLRPRHGAARARRPRAVRPSPAGKCTKLNTITPT